MNREQFEKRQFSGAVIARMFNHDEKEMEKWFEEYRSHFRRKEGTFEITPQLRKMSEEYFRGMPASRLIREYGLSNNATFWKIVAYVEREKEYKVMNYFYPIVIGLILSALGVIFGEGWIMYLSMVVWVTLIHIAIYYQL